MDKKILIIILLIIAIIGISFASLTFLNNKEIKYSQMNVSKTCSLEIPVTKMQ